MTYDEVISSGIVPVASVSGTPYTAGVATNPPPLSVLASVSSALNDAVKAIPAEKNGALVGIVTEKGMNLALVHRVGSDFTVGTWIGKSWGTPGWQFGAQTMLTW